MGVGVKSDSNLAVAEHLGDEQRMDSTLKQQGRHGVSQSVRRQGRQSEGRAPAFTLLRSGRTSNQLTPRPTENEIGISPAVALGVATLVDRATLALDDLDARSNQHH